MTYQSQLSNATQLTLDPAATAIFPHILSNTGNLAETYSFVIKDTIGDSGNLSNLVLVHDKNKSGVFDDGDQEITANYNVKLQPNETAALLIKATVPSTAKVNDIYNVILNTEHQCSIGTKYDKKPNIIGIQENKSLVDILEHLL